MDQKRQQMDLFRIRGRKGKQGGEVTTLTRPRDNTLPYFLASNLPMPSQVIKLDWTTRIRMLLTFLPLDSPHPLALPPHSMETLRTDMILKRHCSGQLNATKNTVAS